ncbi:MAG: PIN domain-containing protein [Myxococcaceae bacterium]
MPPIRNSIIIDAGYLVALFSKRDRFHQAALATRPLIENRFWISTWPVISETCHLLSSIQPLLAQQFLVLCERKILNLFELRLDHFARIKTLMAKYEELPMDLADASLVILAEELGHGDIVSTDRRDFKTYRFKNHQPFRNLLDSTT